MRKAISIVGKRFGRLVVLEEKKQENSIHYICKCQCDCGNIIETRKYSLMNGLTKSCGCLHNDIMTNLGKDNRKHDKLCEECGKKEHYAKGLCKNCYYRLKRKGIDIENRNKKEDFDYNSYYYGEDVLY